MSKKRLAAFILLAGVLLAVPALVFPYIRLDSLKQRLEGAVESRIRGSIGIDALSLGWHSGPVAEARGLRVTFEGEQKPFFEAASVALVPDFGELLRGRLRITDVLVVRPRLALERGTDGSWKVSRLLKPSPGGGGEPPAVARLRIRDGALTVARPGSADIQLTRVDAEVSMPGAGRDISFKAGAAALLSAKRNLDVSGTLRSGASGLESARAALALRFDGVDWTELARRGAETAALPFDGRAVDGVLEADAAFDGRNVSAAGKLAASRMQLTLFSEPVKDVEAALEWNGSVFALKDGRASLGRGTAAFEGDASGFGALPRYRFKAALRGIEVHDLMPPLPPDDRRWEPYGTLNADGEVRFSGSDRQAILSSLTGGGMFEIAGGTIRRINLLAVIADKVSRSAFLGYDIRSVLSPHFAALLSRPDMNVQLVQSRFSIGGGNVRVGEFNFVADEFTVSGDGIVSLLGRVRLGCAFALSPALTTEVAAAVPDAAALADGYGRLVFPFSIAGDLTRPGVVLDRDYIIARVIASKGQRLLKNVLDRGEKAAGSAGSTAGDLLKNVL